MSLQGDDDPMDIAGSAPLGNDLATVVREYATETPLPRPSAHRIGDVVGPLVEDEMITAIADACPQRVLDVGCGTGDLTARVQRELGVEVVGIDLSARMVELAGERGLSVRQGDVQALPFADDNFDCVLANGSYTTYPTSIGVWPRSPAC